MPATVAAPPTEVDRRVELALSMIDLGALVFPLRPGSKIPLIPKRAGGGGFRDAHRDRERCETFLRQAGHPNYGVVFPEGSDVIILDLDGGGEDPRPAWQADWQRLYERLGPPGLTFIVRTPSGGRHAYYRWRTDLYGPLPPGDEMLGWTVRKPFKGYVVGPGSIVNGQTYEPVGNPQIADLPEAWVRAALEESRRPPAAPDARTSITVKGPAQVQRGGRHKFLRDRARYLVGIGLSGDALFSAVMDLNRQLPEPKSEDEVRRAIGEVEAKFEPDELDPDTGRPILSAQRDGAVGRKNVGPPEVLDALTFYSALEVAAMTPEVVDWAWRDYLAHGTIVEIVGPPKAGKTTLVFGLIRAYVAGQPFLDRPTAGGPAVVLTEQGPTSLRAVLQRTSIAERDDVHFLFHRDIRGHEWHDVVAISVARCGELGARLLVVDTLPAFAGLSGEAENNAGDALEAMQPLLDAAASGLAVLVNRHRRKSLPGMGPGDVAEEGRGSGAFSGAVDVILSLRRKSGGGRPTIRSLVAASRFDETPEELNVELVDGRYVALADDAALESDVTRSAVLELLEDAADGLTLPELVEASGKARVVVQRALNDLTKTRDVEVHGRGVRGDPHRYRRPDDEPIPSAQTSHGILSAQTVTPYGGEQSDRLGQRSNPGPESPARAWCHFHAEHQSRHRDVATAAPWCEICTPREGIA